MIVGKKERLVAPVQEIHRPRYPFTVFNESIHKHFVLAL